MRLNKEERDLDVANIQIQLTLLLARFLAVEQKVEDLRDWKNKAFGGWAVIASTGAVVLMAVGLLFKRVSESIFGK